MIALDLFAGAGGWDVAARDLGIEPIGVELDADACATRFAAGLGYVCADVEAYEAAVRYDLLNASPPCQGFSAAGKRDPNDPRNRLVESMWRFIDRDRPTFVAFEQVPLVLPIWERYAVGLRERGYSAWCGLLRAERYGTPQTRKRAILIARRDGREAAPPIATHSAYHPRNPDRMDLGTLPWVSMAGALGWGATVRPSYVVTGGGGDTGGPEPFENRARAALRDLERVELHTNRDQRPDGSRQITDTAAPAPSFTAKAGGQWVFRRPATTIVGSSRPEIVANPGYRLDPKVHRQDAGVKIEVHEAALLQDFPADYPWCGSRTSQFRQIGNAIPVRLARAILSTFVDGNDRG